MFLRPFTNLAIVLFLFGGSAWGAPAAGNASSSGGDSDIFSGKSIAAYFPEAERPAISPLGNDLNAAGIQAFKSDVSKMAEALGQQDPQHFDRAKFMSWWNANQQAFLNPATMARAAHLPMSAFMSAVMTRYELGARADEVKTAEAKHDVPAQDAAYRKTAENLAHMAKAPAWRRVFGEGTLVYEWTVLKLCEARDWSKENFKTAITVGLGAGTIGLIVATAGRPLIDPINEFVGKTSNWLLKYPSAWEQRLLNGMWLSRITAKFRMPNGKTMSGQRAMMYLPGKSPEEVSSYVEARLMKMTVNESNGKNALVGSSRASANHWNYVTYKTPMDHAKDLAIFRNDERGARQSLEKNLDAVANERPVREKLNQLVQAMSDLKQARVFCYTPKEGEKFDEAKELEDIKHIQGLEKRVDDLRAELLSEGIPEPQLDAVMRDQREVLSSHWAKLGEMKGFMSFMVWAPEDNRSYAGQIDVAKRLNGVRELSGFWDELDANQGEMQRLFDREGEPIDVKAWLKTRYFGLERVPKKRVLAELENPGAESVRQCLFARFRTWLGGLRAPKSPR